MSKYAAVVLSAGSGKRMKSDVPKQYMQLLGKPVIYYSLKAFQESDFSEIVLVCGKDDIDYCQQEIVQKYDLTGVTAIVAGGKERYHSVYEGIKAISDADYVFIHDGARPLTDTQTILKLKEEVQVHKAAVAGVPVKDTIKIVDANGFVKETPDRNYVWQVQTPQCFSYAKIRNAYETVLTMEADGENLPTITDDAMVLSRVSKDPIKMVGADYRNIKITTPEDIDVAEKFLQRK